MREGRQPPAENPIAGTNEKSIRLPAVPAEKRKSGFCEATQGLDAATAMAQTGRCLHCGTTLPCVVLKPVDPKRMVIPWDAGKALELWQRRRAEDGEPLPDVFGDVSDVFDAPVDVVGRNRLVLKPANSDELLYYTTDNE